MRAAVAGAAAPLLERGLAHLARHRVHRFGTLLFLFIPLLPMQFARMHLIHGGEAAILRQAETHEARRRVIAAARHVVHVVFLSLQVQQGRPHQYATAGRDLSVVEQQVARCRRR